MRFIGGNIPSWSFNPAKATHRKLAKFVNDEESWFEILMECKHIKFVTYQFKLKIGSNPFNIQLWNTFIEWLKVYDDSKK